MFELDVRDDRVAVVDLARSIAGNLLSPAARDAERAAALPANVAAQLHDTGLIALVGEEHGGGGVPDVVTHLAAVEAFAYGDPGLTMASLWGTAGAALVGACGTSEQQRTLLPALAADPTARLGVALYEGFGRAPSEYATTISPADGEGWRVRGRKLAVAGAGDGSIVVVGVDPSAGGRLRAAVVDGAASGVTVSADDARIALGAAALATVDLDLTIAETALLGGPDSDAEALSRAVGWFRLLVAASLCGTAQRATDYASKYATERIAFGKPIATFQGVSFLLADSALRIGAARLELFDVAASLDARATNIEAAVSRAVTYAGVVGAQATRDAIQVLGGHGFITDHPVEIWYRSAAALAVLDSDPLLSSFEPAL